MTIKHWRWEFKAIKEQYGYILYKPGGWIVKQLPFKANWPLELNYKLKKLVRLLFMKQEDDFIFHTW